MSAALDLLDQVDDAVAQGAPDRRGKMLRHITDLFIVRSDQCSDEELALFDDVFVRLADEIEASARALLAVRLAPVANAPRKIIRTLAFDDEIDVAAPVLEQSERLDDQSLIANAKKKSQAHLLAISRRRALSPAVTDVLVVRGDQQIILSAAENPGARFSDSGFSILVRRSDGDDRLTECVGARPEIPEHLFLKLLANASAAVRARLEAAHPHAKVQVRDAVAEVAQRMKAQVLDAKMRYTEVRKAQDEPSSDGGGIESGTLAAIRPGQVDDGKLAAIAKGGRLDEVAAALALMTGLPRDFVNSAITQKRPDTILIIARSVGLSWTTVKAVLAVRGNQGLLAESELAAALARFERLNPATSLEIVRYYRMRERADHKPRTLR